MYSGAWGFTVKADADERKKAIDFRGFGKNGRSTARFQWG